MINTQLKFEGKIDSSLKVVAFTGNYPVHNFVQFQGQFDLEGQVQDHQF